MPDAIPAKNIGTTTGLLSQHNRGDTEAFSKVIGRVLGQFKEIAGKRLRRLFHRSPSAMTLGATAIANDVLWKLARQRTEWKNSDHFNAVGAILLTRQLSAYRRHRMALKRPRGNRGLRDQNLINSVPADRCLDIDAGPMLDPAMAALADDHPKYAQVLLLNFWGEKTHPQIAEALDISEKTVARYRTAGLLYLRDYLSKKGTTP